MFFVLTNSLKAFMELIDVVFHSYLDSIATIFIENILVYSKSKVSHEAFEVRASEFDG